MGYYHTGAYKIDDFECALKSWPYARPHDLGYLKLTGQRWTSAAIVETDDQWNVLVSDKTDMGDWWAVLSRLSFDSALFGLEEARLEPVVTPEYFDPLNEKIFGEARHFISQILAEAERGRVDHITAPVSTQDSFTCLLLQKSGFTMSDTTVIHELNLDSYQMNDPCNSIRPAREDDLEELALISVECFADRRNNVNRFNSDPAFNSKAVASLYRQWITKSVEKILADEVLVYEADGRPVAFITMKLDNTQETPQNEKIGKIPLNAVKPGYQNRGIYTALTKASINWMKESQTKNVEIRTQLSNIAVHRTWQRQGATISYAAHTFRYALAPPAK